jgi:glycosyltransferase involved in cell wall biosynthesis
MVTNSPQKRKFFNKHWLRARLTFPFSDLIIANSKAGLQAFSAPHNKGVVIYNGFDFNRLDNIQKKDLVKEQLNAGQKYVIGMVATFSANKDYSTFFAAACSLLSRRKDVIFLAIGNQTDSDDSMELIGKQYIEFFRLLGRRTGIESYINAMDICSVNFF